MGRSGFALAGLLLALTLRPASSQMLDAVRKEGRMPCGTVSSVEDWNGSDQHGDLSGLGGEICRAVAAAVLGDPAKADLVRFPAEPEALAALQAGTVALVVGLSPSAEAAVQYNVAFGRPVFLDSVRLLVPEAAGRHSVADLRGRLICAMNNTPAERTLRDEMTAQHIEYGLQAHSEQGEMSASVGVAHCAAGAAMESRLADFRADFPANAPGFVFLPERFGLAPVTPAWRYGDQKFGLIVDATTSALLEAEALGIGRDNVEAARSRHDLRADRLLGHDRSVGQALGLRPDWAVTVIAAVGNYGDIFERTVAKPFGLDRGLNALWTQNGLLYPQPLQ